MIRHFVRALVLLAGVSCSSLIMILILSDNLWLAKQIQDHQTAEVAGQQKQVPVPAPQVVQMAPLYHQVRADGQVPLYQKQQSKKVGQQPAPAHQQQVPQVHEVRVDYRQSIDVPGKVFQIYF